MTFFKMSKYYIWPDFQMSKYDIRLDLEFQNIILNVKIRYLARYRMPKLDFECQNTIFDTSSNVKIGFECQNMIFAPISHFKIGF